MDLERLKWCLKQNKGIKIIKPNNNLAEEYIESAEETLLVLQNIKNKSKFKNNLRSKDKVAQHNELLLKVICHNICVVIQEMYELGINPNFHISLNNKDNNNMVPDGRL
ncbi:hypothetical protein HY498_02325 [Candidatus Woesearchaeota archaeon]|nr:hypothetical protein [Candidatus Woesearchaeota archaeon]